ncbi:hypothetical protein O3M35_003969 [Rhynocoris fuscipes]|uniref:U3 small nucleolar ribonucleoprotein protein IMP3 n=1 Tax=Rhynocoris fuscipes TaxID=488301 RepID=A0AAW1CNK6_9HEMI
MVRKLKFHEKKLLKKVDFINWEVDNNLEEVRILKKYCVLKRGDYRVYNILSRDIRTLARKIKELDSSDPFRSEQSAELLQNLYLIGIIDNKWDLSVCNRVSPESFCKRRLPVIMVKNKMVNSVKLATQFIEQGQVRVGPELIKDPAFLVPRNMEDFITWVDFSKIRKHILTYNDMVR